MFDDVWNIVFMIKNMGNGDWKIMIIYDWFCGKVGGTCKSGGLIWTYIEQWDNLNWVRFISVIINLNLNKTWIQSTQIRRSLWSQSIHQEVI